MACSNKTYLLIGLVLVLLPATTPGQQPSKDTGAIFTFDDDPKIPRSEVKVAVKVNGRQVLPADANLAKKVPIANTGFDRIDAWIGDKKSSTLARLHPGKEYRVRYNPCSHFEIIPKDASDRGHGTYRFQVDSKSKKPIWFMGGLLSTALLVSPGETSREIENEVSANCSFARTFFSAYAEEPDWEDKPLPTLADVSFQFLHDEHVIVRYRGNRRSLEVTLAPTTAPTPSPEK